jgi:hypothetical protein
MSIVEWLFFPSKFNFEHSEIENCPFLAFSFIGINFLSKTLPLKESALVHRPFFSR